MRCLDKNEAESLLLDSFASDELLKHLSGQYGEIEDMFHINYKPAEILNRFMRGGKNVSTDEIQEFEEALTNAAGEQKKDQAQVIEEASFEDLLNLCREDLGEEKKGEGEEGKKGGKKKNVEVVVEDLRKKEKKMLGLDK
jgi:hypothetical protein